MKAAMGATASINIHLNTNASNLTAYQFVLSLPQGIWLEQDANGNYAYDMSERYADNCQLTINSQPSVGEGFETAHSIVAASVTGGTILPGNGTLLTLTAHVDEDLPEGYYEASLTRILFADTNANELFCNDVRFNIFVTTAAGITSATIDDRPTPDGIYNLQGQKMKHPTSNTQHPSSNTQLPPGIYIVNGKKVVVK